jgi:serine/threonine protein kinase
MLDQKGRTRLDLITELSKSRLFTIQDGTLVLAVEPDPGLSQPDRLPEGIVDKKYQILGLLGQGGMGAVFRAHHLMLDKDVALKTFRYANLSEEAVLRFQREAQAIARLNHKNIVQIFDFGLSEDGVPYYTMEYLQGESLAERIRNNGPLPLGRAIQFFGQLCHGLSLAHSKGIIHRDLKPGNIFIENTAAAAGKSDTLKIVDFGIASLTNQTLDGQKLTTGGTVFGSPLYMSPEQSMGQAVTERADIYSLGCTLFEALAGTPPFRGANALETIMLHHSSSAPTLKEASGGSDYPPALEQVLAKMLAKNPGERQASVEQVERELLQLGAYQSGSSNRVGPSIKGSALPAGASISDTGQETIPPWHRRRLPLTLLAGCVITGLAVIGYHMIPTQTKNTSTTTDKKPTDASARSSEAGHTNNSASRQSASVPAPDLACTVERNPQGKNIVVFTFPKTYNPGQFSSPGPECILSVKPGRISWPAGGAAAFAPSAAFLQNPANLDLFMPDKLSVLKFEKDTTLQNNPEVIRHVAGLTGLKILYMDSNSLSDDDLSELLKRLRHLSCISLNNTNIQGPTLANFPGIKEFCSISFSNDQDAHDLVLALKDSQSLQYLYLDEDNLTAPDFKTIGTMSNLIRLQVSGNHLQSSDLLSLASLKHLKRLTAKKCPITAEALGALKKLAKNGLTDLEISEGDWSEADKAVLVKTIAGTKFDKNILKESGADSPKDWAQFINQ